MKKPNITPGDWRAPLRHFMTDITGDNKGFIQTDNGAIDLCAPPCQSNDEFEANAQAIAALPKLLEALEKLAEIGNAGVIQRNETGKPQWSALDEVKSITKAALLAAGYIE